jgi:hypothetical protein
VLPFAAVVVAWAVATLHARRPSLVRAWAAAALVLAALLCPPAMGIATRASDATVRALVSPAALDPATQ